MRYAVLGAGGVGGLVGGALARAGHPVTLLVRSDRQRYYPELLTVESKTLGTFEAPVRVTDRLDEPVDVVWITVKATALEAALDAVPEQKLGDGVVVPLLNGVDHVAQLRERYGPERVVPGTIRVEVERLEPGRVLQNSLFAELQVAPTPATRARAEALADELRAAGLGCGVCDDEVTMLWSKLCFLAPFALATTALGARSGLFDRRRAGMRAWRHVLKRPAPSESPRVPRSLPNRSSRRSKGRPTNFEVRCKRTWRRGRRRSSTPSRAPSSVAAASTGPTCPRLGLL